MSSYPQFDRASANTPLTDDELEAFDSLLQALPTDGAMNVEGVDGYLTAMLLAPPAWLDTWPTADWLPLIWGGDGPDGEPFASGRQRKRATLFALRHLQATATTLREQPRHWQPLFSIVEADGDSGEEWIDAQDWCTGFLQAIDLNPADWADWRADPELGPVLGTIALLGGDEPTEDGSDEDADVAADHAGQLADPEARDALAREVASGVLAMHARRYPSADA